MIIKPLKKGSYKKSILFSIGLDLFFILLISIVLIFCLDLYSAFFRSDNVFDKGFVLNYIEGVRSKPKKIYLDIKFKDYQKLTYKRERALERGVIITEEDSYVPATMHSDKENLKVDIRLKGDMVDHISGDKWSLRVKVKNGKTLAGMSTFSLQDPRLSAYINEWVRYKLLAYEKLINIRYEYIELFINGKNMGIYAIEESFSQEMIEANHRRNGPILKFNEGMLWNNSFNYRTYLEEIKESYLESSIEVFQDKKVANDSILSSNYIRAKELLQKFKNGDKLSQVFDIDSAAKTYAIHRLTVSGHALLWKNVRFYYNPITDKLELISYNAYSSSDNMSAWVIDNLETDLPPDVVMEYQNLFFSNKEFINKYLYYLDYYSDASYLSKFEEYIDKDLKKNLAIIYRDYPNFKFSYNIMHLSQVLAKKALSSAIIPSIEKAQLDLPKYVKVDNENKKIIIESGNWIINENLVIPKDYIFEISDGVNLDLINSSYILSYSPIKFIGSEEKPINIFSSDKTGQGLIVLNARDESKLEYVNFNDLHALNQNFWQLTGAITFYESAVIINNCLFSNNMGSDDLVNIVRSDFEITNSIFKNSFADALDVDFGSGIIRNSQFINSANDGIDFSGSFVDLSEIKISNAGDKGISVGEKSSLKAQNIIIDGAKIGIASKDLSDFNVENINILNADYGLATYQKKEAFGPATIKLDNISFINVKENYIVEKESSIIIDNKIYKGSDKNVLKIIYHE